MSEEFFYDAGRQEEYLWRRSRKLGLSRREFLKLWAAGSAALWIHLNLPPAARAAGNPPVLKPTPSNLFIDHRGSNKEMRWENLHGRGHVVPNALFFVRNHTSTPILDPALWKLKVEGSGVSRPLDFSYGEILRMPSITLTRYVECAGNGRSFFKAVYGKEAAGVQWRLGGIGVAAWTGVRLSEVLLRAGLKKNARDVLLEGLDELGVRRPIPISKALEHDTLLVYGMNGRKLPPDHGFPVRALVPGWIGVASIKWLGRIEVSEKPIFTLWNTENYVLMGPGYPADPPRKGPVLSYSNVKSALELAWDARLSAVRHRVRGRAWSPFARIAGVEYSVDGGARWHPARLLTEGGAGNWARFEFPWNPKPGHYAILVRAHDAQGNKQPDTVPWNALGYLYNGVVKHPVTVV